MFKMQSILVVTLVALLGGVADAAPDKNEEQALAFFHRVLREWTPGPLVADSVQWALDQNREPTDVLFSSLENFHATSDGFGCYEMAFQIRELQGLTEEEQRRAVHLAAVLAADFTYGGAGIPNAGLSAIHHFLSRSRFPAIRLLAAQASYCFGDAPGGDHSGIYFETVKILRGAYLNETNQSVKIEIEKVLKDRYATGTTTTPSAPTLAGKISACLFGLLDRASRTQSNYTKDI